MTGFYYMICYDCCKAHPSKYRFCPNCGAKLSRWDTNGGGGTIARAKE